MSKLHLPTSTSTLGWRNGSARTQKRPFDTASRITSSQESQSSSVKLARCAHPPSKAEPMLNRTVFVRPSIGLVSPTQALSLLSELSKRFGPIQSFHFPREPHHQRLLGYGSVTFADIKSVDKAANSSGSFAVNLPSLLPSRAPRTYLDDANHARFVGLEPLVSCNSAEEDTPAKHVHYSSRNLQNPSSMRPSWSDLGRLISMKTAPAAYYVDESHATESTPFDALLTHDSTFFISDSPISVYLKIERRRSSFTSKTNAAEKRSGHRLEFDPDTSHKTATHLRAFGGFSGVITKLLDEEDAQPPQSQASRRVYPQLRGGDHSLSSFVDNRQKALRLRQGQERPSRHSPANNNNNNKNGGLSHEVDREWSIDPRSKDSLPSHTKTGMPYGVRDEQSNFSRKGDTSSPGRRDVSDAFSRMSSLIKPQSQRHMNHRRESTPRDSRSGLDSRKQSRHYSSSALAPDKAARKAEWKRNRHSNFVDQITVRLNGGKGGDGCVSFHREKFIEYGPPSGGNGGNGGSVYIRAVDGPTSLARIARRVRANDAHHGQGSFLHGRKAADKIIEVPVGTVLTAVKRLRVKEDEEAQIYRNDLLSRAARCGWDPNRLVEKDSIVLAAENSERERLRSSLGLSHDENAEQDQEALDEFQKLAEKIDGEALLDPEAAQQLQNNRDRVWRHYPRAAETNYKRNEFRSAEMRLALDYRRQLSSSRSPNDADDQSAASVTPFEDGDDVTDDAWQFDFDEPTPEGSRGLLLASGGKGGYGNGTFLTSTNRSPKFATKGERGEVLEILLELKKPSDIGLVGLPNAGKSTILRSLSASRAEVGHWQFTTLSPNLGVVRLDEQGNVLGVDKSEVDEGHGSDSPVVKDSSEEGYRLVLADIPGLIDGASDNRGLGHTFLRHIERCSVLAYVLDLNASDPSKDLRVLHSELASYRAELVRNAQLIIVNKADLFGTEEQVNIAKQKLDKIRLEATRIWEDVCAIAKPSETLQMREFGPMRLVAVSAKKKQGTDVLAKALVDLLKAKRVQEEAIREHANHGS